MRLQDANEMLDANPHAFEEGCKRLSDGLGLVAARTFMPECKGAMIDWWFSHIHTTEQYLEWHPADHVWSDWTGPRDQGVYIGGTHRIHERFGDSPINKLKLNFRDPSAILDVKRFPAAGVSTAIYGRGGPLNLPFWTAHVLHLVHDTAEGCVMRSRFWLGDISPNLPVIARRIRREMTGDKALTGLHGHCKEEMTILAGFLPAKYRQAKGKAA